MYTRTLDTPHSGIVLCSIVSCRQALLKCCSEDVLGDRTGFPLALTRGYRVNRCGPRGSVRHVSWLPRFQEDGAGSGRQTNSGGRGRATLCDEGLRTLGELRKREKAGLGLIGCLERHGLLESNNRTFLIKCLKDMGRRDLADLLAPPEDVQSAPRRATPSSSSAFALIPAASSAQFRFGALALSGK